MLLRTILVWAIGLPLTAVAFLLVMVSLFMGRGIAHSIGVIWCRIILVLAGVRVSVRGIENIPREGSVIFASNHQGAFDIPVLQARLPRDFRWVAKRSLFNIPLIGWTMSMSGYIAIDREDAHSAYKSMEEAAQKIRKGASVVIFPEGTRSHKEGLLPFKRGAFILAERSKAPIVPVAIKGTSGIMKKGGFLIRPSDVTISIGRPIEIGDNTAKGLLKETRQSIAALLEAR
jgi:1-acyl-sn-glycerol-3-phosphate acyltransferase